MTRLQRFKFLQVFGDGNKHSWFNVVWLGVQFLKVRQSAFENMFKEALAYDLIRRVPTDEVRADLVKMADHKTGIFVGLDWTRYEYVIAPKGDECLRNEQIAREGDVSYYKYYDRSLEGANGLQKYAPIPKGYQQL